MLAIEDAPPVHLVVTDRESRDGAGEVDEGGDFSGGRGEAIKDVGGDSNCEGGTGLHVENVSGVYRAWERPGGQPRAANRAGRALGRWGTLRRRIERT